MPPAFRTLTRAGALAFAVGACSDNAQTILQSMPRGCPATDTGCREAGSSDAGGPTADAAEGPKLDLGKCFGTNIDCVSDPELQPYSAGPTLECKEQRRGQGTLLFRKDITNVSCPNPPCHLTSAAVRAAADGSVGVAGQLALPSGDMGGIWLSRFSPNGDLVHEVIAGFAVPTHLSQPRFHVFTGVDSTLNAYALDLVGLIDGPRVATIVRYDGAGVGTELTSIPNIAGCSVTVAPSGEFIANAEWWGNGWDASHEAIGKELDLSRYDARGRLLWNQIKLTRALVTSYVEAIGFDVDGNVLVNLVRETTGSGRLPNHMYVSPHVNRVAQVDRNGNLRWLVELPSSFGLEFSVARSGALYVLRQPLVTVDGGYDFGPWVLERLDESGRSSWILPVPESSQTPTMTTDSSGDLFLATTRGGRGFPESVVEFHRISPSGMICSSFEVPVDFCAPNGGSYCATPELEPGPEGSIYFATTDVVGRVASP